MNFQIFREYFFSTQSLKINFSPCFNVRELILLCHLDYLSKMIPWKFCKDLFILTSKISFEKIWKNTDFRKSRKKFGQNGWKETNFLNTFSEPSGPKEKREGETSPEIWKKVKITAPYCAVCYQPDIGHCFQVVEKPAIFLICAPWSLLANTGRSFVCERSSVSTVLGPKLCISWKK